MAMKIVPLEAVGHLILLFFWQSYFYYLLFILAFPFENYLTPNHNGRYIQYTTSVVAM
jgi:hypothetical protein